MSGNFWSFEVMDVELGDFVIFSVWMEVLLEVFVEIIVILIVEVWLI